MKNRNLFLCNTVYQVMVALWIKQHHMKDVMSDIIITDHMSNAKEIAKRMKKTKCFEYVTYLETLEIARYRVKWTRKERICYDIFPKAYLNKHINCNFKYSDLFVANFDGFTQMLFNGLSHINNKLKLHLYEDGLSTYCLFERYYNDMRNYYGSNDGKFKAFLKNKIYKKRNTYDNLDEILVFNPQVMKWNPGCKITEIDKIDPTDAQYKMLINEVFAYEDSIDRYESKYIYFEESFYADGYKINDVELIQKLAEQVGKENIMIKIHPRNPENRFEKLGYKTNKDTSIPWEVILLNIENATNKVFVTIASQAILNPIMIFGMQIKAYSLYPCLTQIPETLKGESWKFLYGLFEEYSDMISLCDDIKNIN